MILLPLFTNDLCVNSIDPIQAREISTHTHTHWNDGRIQRRYLYMTDAEHNVFHSTVSATITLYCHKCTPAVPLSLYNIINDCTSTVWMISAQPFVSLSSDCIRKPNHCPSFSAEDLMTELNSTICQSTLNYNPLHTSVQQWNWPSYILLLLLPDAIMAENVIWLAAVSPLWYLYKVMRVRLEHACTLKHIASSVIHNPCNSMSWDFTELDFCMCHDVVKLFSFSSSGVQYLHLYYKTCIRWIRHNDRGCCMFYRLWSKFRELSIELCSAVDKNNQTD